jgi:uncharacterized membrane protein YidH (DUF202 family)
VVQKIKKKKKIPLFLLIIGIFSLVGSLIAIINNLYSLLSFGFTIELLDMVSRFLPHNMSDFYHNFKQYGVFLFIVTLLSNAFCIYAVILMFKLRRSGFYLYSVFEILPLVLNYSFLGFLGLTKLNTTVFGLTLNLMFFGTLNRALGPLIVSFSIIIPIAFILMYASNLKKMKKTHSYFE